jgi:hypothetical protein
MFFVYMNSNVHISVEYMDSMGYMRWSCAACWQNNMAEKFDCSEEEESESFVVREWITPVNKLQWALFDVSLIKKTRIWDDTDWTQ